MSKVSQLGTGQTPFAFSSFRVFAICPACGTARVSTPLLSGLPLSALATLMQTCRSSLLLSRKRFHERHLWRRIRRRQTPKIFHPSNMPPPG